MFVFFSQDKFTGFVAKLMNIYIYFFFHEVYRNYIRRKGKVSRNDPSGNDPSRKANGVVRERRRKLNDFLTIRRGEERVFNQKEIFSRKKEVENIG